jgi:hypothetical protein
MFLGHFNRIYRGRTRLSYFFTCYSTAPTNSGDISAKKTLLFSSVKHIDEFVPEENIPGEFLDDAIKTPTSSTTAAEGWKEPMSSDDEDNGNPMVAGFTDEVELDELPATDFSTMSRLNPINSRDKSGEITNIEVC